jgi:hypothetical protein
VRKKREGGWAGPKERRGRGVKGVWVFFFFQTPFQTFCKLHSNNKTMYSNHDAQALIASKLLK